MYHYDAVNPDANLDAQHRIAKNLRFLRIAHTKIHSIESREFQKKFLALSSKNQLRITEELFQISTAAKGGNTNEK